MGAAFLFALLVATMLSACAGNDVAGGSRAAVTRWAQSHGFVAETLAVGRFKLLELARVGRSDALTIYIEGDGAAWPSQWVPPTDPTPRRAVALELAAADSGSNVIYLGRPCQYLDETELRRCDVAYWTQRRYSEEVVAAYMEVLDRLNPRGTARLRLVGHSGGGVIATLLAQRRSDIGSLITVASPLALGTWTTHHGVSALAGSLDPSLASKRFDIRQAVHFVGERDTVVPIAVVEDFVRRQGGRVVAVADQEHECCWGRRWPRLLEGLE